jgi:hypothetical protein
VFVASQAVAFPLGGTALAFVTGSELRLRDLKSGTELCRRALGDSVSAPTFSPDGSRLAFIRPDGSVALCGLESSSTRLPEAPSAADLPRLWADLAAADPRVAYRATSLLSVSGPPGTRLLAKHLRPITTALTARIPRLIADLDDDRFVRREAAEKELARLDTLAEAALRRELAATKSVEVRSRIKRLLAALALAFVQDSETLRHLRAIFVLQRIGNRDARALLQRLADGAPEARVTQAARSALRCLPRKLGRK